MGQADSCLHSTIVSHSTHSFLLLNASKERQPINTRTSRMAAILQYRRLCNRAKQQLGNLADPVEHAQDSLPCTNNGSTTLDDPGGFSAG
jgi:hypothetical protein